MKIEDTCCCGAEFSVDNELGKSEELLVRHHDSWLSAHRVCREMPRRELVGQVGMETGAIGPRQPCPHCGKDEVVSGYHEHDHCNSCSFPVRPSDYPLPAVNISGPNEC